MMMFDFILNKETKLEKAQNNELYFKKDIS